MYDKKSIFIGARKRDVDLDILSFDILLLSLFEMIDDPN